jgi:hypothetical protein
MRDRAVETSQKATSIINETLQQNPLLVGGLGLAIGMLIASALPQSDVEKGVLNDAGAQARKQANDLASKGFDAAKGIAAGSLRTSLRKLSGKDCRRLTCMPRWRISDVAFERSPRAPQAPRSAPQKPTTRRDARRTKAGVRHD